MPRIPTPLRDSSSAAAARLSFVLPVAPMIKGSGNCIGILFHACCRATFHASLATQNYQAENANKAVMRTIIKKHAGERDLPALMFAYEEACYKGFMHTEREAAADVLALAMVDAQMEAQIYARAKRDAVKDALRFRAQAKRLRVDLASADKQVGGWLVG